MLEEKINELGDRYITNGIYEGYKYVKVNIPEEWNVEIFDGNVDAQRDINNPTIVVFGSDSPDISFSTIIDVIFEFIKPYLAVLEKGNLFNSFVEKLEAIFIENDLETLKTLSFTFPERQKRPYNKTKNIPDLEIVEKAVDKRELLVEDKELLK